MARVHTRPIDLPKDVIAIEHGAGKAASLTGARMRLLY